jgi:two-component system OmpR family response regulator
MGWRCEGKVLVVDDGPDIRALLSATLRLVDFGGASRAQGRALPGPTTSSRPGRARRHAARPRRHRVARRLRETGQTTPCSSSPRGTRSRRISGLTIGADDYVTKPFSLESSCGSGDLRRAPRRRAERRRPALRRPDGEDAHIVRRAGKVVDLSPTELTTPGT